MPPPDHRARAVKANQFDATDALLLQYAALLRGEEAADAAVPFAADLYEDYAYRHIVSALLLTKAEPQLIWEALDIPVQALNVFGYLFFDRAQIPHALAAARYVQSLSCPDNLREIYETALRRGPSTIIERFRVGARPPVDPQQVLMDLMGDSHQRFLEHRGKSITSAEASECLKWGQAGLKAALLVNENNKAKNRSDNAITDLVIALKHRDGTKSAEDLGVTALDLVRGD